MPLISLFFKKTENVFVLILANVIFSMFFLASLAVFFGVLALIYYFLFNRLFKIDLGVKPILTTLFFSLIPYILINSFSNTLLYNIITVFNVSIGFLGINFFFLWSFLLFFFGLSNNMGINIKQGLIYIFIPFISFLIVVLFVFSGSIRINVLGF